MKLSEDFALALRDYRLLLNRGYPIPSTLKLVGDRYRLSHTERMILFRGVLDDEKNEKIHMKLVSTLPKNASLAIDGFNVLFTLINYRRGHPLFISTDGLLRDAGGAHGRIERTEDWDWARTLFCETLLHLPVGPLWVYLDAPVSHSGEYRHEIEQNLKHHEAFVQVMLEDCADIPLQTFTGTAIASSDSTIALRCKTSIFDLARYILETSYHAQFLDVGAYTYET
ncbi:DUF434 domain-containing protein [Treponema sp. J25]|uniref:DUF434 domain-containing protein n=1 Tax=Treponema sp. J25 TaxID=2094121 RepID=UPI001043463B|nr:DUF434 domain-containing protein [Treponema sp. J25]TCW60248.1 DUF434 domain-containing protein [Treponema sp. J25]